MADRSSVLIKDYNSAQQQLAQMQNFETHKRNIDSQVASALAEVNRQEGLLSRYQNDDAYLQKRIHRNENPRFLHYFVCNRQRKVEGLKRDLQQLMAQEQLLSDKITTDGAQLANLRQQQQQANAHVEQKHQLESHCRVLFDQVVDGQPPTQALQQLTANLQQQRVLLGAEQGLLQGISNSVTQVQQGLSLFQQAQGLYRQAYDINERAKQVNRAEAYEERREFRDERFGNEIGAQNAEWHRQNLERQERQLQAERDSLINQAHDVAMRAYQVISSAFSTFPVDARTRYPQLCNSIGQVAFPRVQGANFNNALMCDMIFGTMGAAMNDFSSGCTIQNNVRIVEQCVSMSSQQLGYITAIQNAVQATIQQMTSSVHSYEQNISVERTNIFNAVRMSVVA